MTIPSFLQSTRRPAAEADPINLGVSSSAKGNASGMDGADFAQTLTKVQKQIQSIERHKTTATKSTSNTKTDKAAGTNIDQTANQKPDTATETKENTAASAEQTNRPGHTNKEQTTQADTHDQPQRTEDKTANAAPSGALGWLTSLPTVLINFVKPVQITPEVETKTDIPPEAALERTETASPGSNTDLFATSIITDTASHLTSTPGLSSSGALPTGQTQTPDKPARPEAIIASSETQTHHQTDANITGQPSEQQGSASSPSDAEPQASAVANNASSATVLGALAPLAGSIAVQPLSTPPAGKSFSDSSPSAGSSQTLLPPSHSLQNNLHASAAPLTNSRANEPSTPFGFNQLLNTHQTDLSTGASNVLQPDKLNDQLQDLAIVDPAATAPKQTDSPSQASSLKAANALSNLSKETLSSLKVGSNGEALAANQPENISGESTGQNLASFAQQGAGKQNGNAETDHQGGASTHTGLKTGKTNTAMAFETEVSNSASTVTIPNSAPVPTTTDTILTSNTSNSPSLSELLPDKNALLFQSKAMDAADQVADGIQHARLNNRNELVVVLNPERLGNVQLQLSSNAQQQVSARLIASNPEAQELLQKQVHTLKESLEAQGIQVEKISIALAGKTEATNNANSQFNQQSSSDPNNQQSQQQTNNQQFNQSQHQQQAQTLYQQFNQSRSPANWNTESTPDNGSPVTQEASTSTNTDLPDRKTVNDNGSVSILA